MSQTDDTASFETLHVELCAGGVCRITMARPEVLNAFNETMIDELDRAFNVIALQGRARVIVLGGAGKHFSAGADLKWMERASQASKEWNLKDAKRFVDLLFRISSSPIPTVARIQGVALGGGVGLTCACDIALTADNASFAVSEARFGILPAVIGPYLYQAVGKRQATYLALSTRRIQAREALTMGLVHEVVPLGELDQAIDNLVQDLLLGGPDAQREIKALFAGFQHGPIHEQVRDHTAQTISRVRASDEAKEGFRAFFEKRKANWVS